jgi:4-aminobutyrate aminotransferase/(S)-3-amino-2-methylpropionate transaminase
MFYKKLRKLAHDEGIPFIVDETKTGVGATGKMWGHEHWYLQNDTDGGCPDFVTFGGRAGISGFYSTLKYKLHPHCTSFSQDVDMVKLMTYHVIWTTIQRKRLLDKVQDTSSFLKIELGNIARDQGFIKDVRGYGCFLAFDCHSRQQADSIHDWLLKGGIQLGRIGPNTLCVRPALILKPKNAAHLRDTLAYFHPNHSV